MSTRDDLDDADVLLGAVEDWAQVDIERALVRRAGASSRARVELRNQAREAGRAKANYKLVRAQTALRYRADDIRDGVPSRGAGSITESVREARVDADEQVKDAALAYYVAEALFDAEQEAARLLRAEMAAFQSVLADIRPMVSER